MLTVLENNKNLGKVNSDGETKPFFWLGDTAWLLAQKLSMDEADLYFSDRENKHYNVIQSVLVHNMNVEDAKPENLAFIDGDFAKINLESGYWDKIDKLIELASEYDLYMGLLPVWGSMVKKGYLTQGNAMVYGKFLADRYGKYKNIIWVLGGDIRGETGYEIWNTLGKLIKSKNPKTLITFHPFGRTSSAMWFNDCDWIDFNMFQSGHRRYDQGNLGIWDDNNISEDFYGEDNWRYVKRELSRTPIKPVLDAEPSYENIPQGLHDFTEPFWEAKDVRRYAYWSVFEGACGHTYGSNAIMQFYQDGDKYPGYNVQETWQTALNLEGSSHMKYMYELVTCFDFANASHNDQLVDNCGFTKHNRITALSGKDFAFVYNYSGRDFSVDLSNLEFSPEKFLWYDPTNGKYSEYNYDTYHVIKTPKNSKNETDMVLVLK